MPGPDDEAWSADLLIELAARRGVTLDRARAEALRGSVQSLFGRLERLSRTLPESAAPPPSRFPLRGLER